MSAIRAHHFRSKSVPFYAIHLGVIAAFFVPFEWSYLAVAVGLYYLRMFGITAGYHRYFSHRSYKTSRPMQFILAILGSLSCQKGVLWWAAHHRTHHRYSGTEKDVHAPEQKGFWWSHVGWILDPKSDDIEWSNIKDFSKFPELKWLNTYFLVPPLLLAAILWAIGGFPLFIWGFVISTVAGFHGTFVINSLCHMFGRRRFKTVDDSRNSLILALVTLGEGWHNNHHHYQASARQGMYWWELDGSYMILKMMSWLGLVWDLKTYPEQLYQKSYPSRLALRPVMIPVQSSGNQPLNR